MSASTGVAPARRIAADRSKKAERGGYNAHSGANSGRGQRQPQGVGARRAAQRVPHAQLLLRGALKGRHMLAKNELLRFQHLPKRIQQFLVNAHGIGASGPASARAIGAVDRPRLPNHEVGRRCLAHLDAISQSGRRASHGRRQSQTRPRKPVHGPVSRRNRLGRELKWIANLYNVVTLRGLSAPGVPEPSPRT